MSLSDCIHCWDTPCTCGWEYRTWSVQALEKQVNLFNKIIEFKKNNPSTKFGFHQSKYMTEDEEELMKILRLLK